MNVLSKSLNFLKPYVRSDMRRYGRFLDGGYVLPEKEISDIDYMISMGISDDWSLEEDLYNKLKINIDAYDHTIGRRRFWREVRSEVYKLLVLRSNLRTCMQKIRVFVSYGNFFKGNVRHFQERISGRYTYGGDVVLTTVFGRVPANVSSIFLKIDIEGSEYRILKQLEEYVDRVRVLAIEFHATEPFRPVFLECVRRLQLNMDIVHLHGNNDAGCADDGLPDAVEITFVRRSTSEELHQDLRTRLPIEGLDTANDQRYPDIQMIFDAN